MFVFILILLVIIHLSGGIETIDATGGSIKLPEGIASDQAQYVNDAYEKFMTQRKQQKEAKRREQELMDTIGITEEMSDEEKDEKYNKYMQEQYRQMEEVMGIEPDMPIEEKRRIHEEFMQKPKEEQQQIYNLWREDHIKKEKEKHGIPHIEPISPKELNLKRDPDTSNVPLTDQVEIKGGLFYMGTQLMMGDKVRAAKLKDGADVRKLVKCEGPYKMDIDVVTNKQFKEFVEATDYKTEAEIFGWSFVLENLVSESVIAEVDGEKGYGRVKDAPHWLAVKGADWKHPFGNDSINEDIPNYPVVHVSFKDGLEYCNWAGRRLPTEKEFEFGARGGLVNNSYPWGNDLIPKRMNSWEGDFPEKNKLTDGYLGLAPVLSYAPNAYGLYNTVGNVWEWVLGGKPEARILRGGSFIDSTDGSFNHLLFVSTKQINAGDSGGSNIGFRCVTQISNKKKKKKNPKIEL